MKNIAIIDDEEDILHILHTYFTRTGKFNVVTYSNPLDALVDVQNKKYDLILLDIMMPELSGLEFLQKIKEEQIDLHVIIMTAYSSIDRAVEAHQLGALDFITKPFSSLSGLEELIIKNLEI